MRMLQTKAVRARRGFTLVELIVVIAIIGVLMALLIGTVTKVRDRVAVSRTFHDISQLRIALESFKAENGFYPPSRMKLYTTLSAQQGDTSQLSQDTLYYLTRLAPRIADPTSTWAASSIDWGGAGATSYDLEGDQCLVFWLGGWETTSNNVPGCQGFSADPRNPWQAPTTGQMRKGPYYDFNPKQLVKFHSGSPFLSCLDSYGTSDGQGNAQGSSKPFAYFSSYKKPNGYNRYSTSTSECSALGVWPYAQDTSNSGNIRYWNAEGYQIISAGKDQTFGHGTDPTAGSPAWTPSVAGSATSPSAALPLNSKQQPAGSDDQSNFYGSVLGTPGA